jgi:hypothetical protein
MQNRQLRASLVVLSTLVGCGEVSVSGGAGDARPVDAATGAMVDAPVPDAEPKGPAVVMTYDLEQELEVAGDDLFVPDASGSGRRGQVLTTLSKTPLVERFERGDEGFALHFPAVCPVAPCPRAILEVEESEDQNPGPRNFAVTVDILLEPASADPAPDENVMQKGNFDSPGQWKVEIDGLRQPVCTFHYPTDGSDPGPAPAVRIGQSIDDGFWHRVRCEHEDGKIRIVLDDGVDMTEEAAPGTVDIANELPIRIGGQNLGDTSDQFHGDLDNISVEFLE